jgi:hypothetical protein
VKFAFSKGERNCHGTQKKGEPWNKETVRGPKLVFFDIKKENAWQKGFGARCFFFWRWIFYFPSGSCWYIDVFQKAKDNAAPQSITINQ